MATTLEGGGALKLPQATGVKVTPTNWGGIQQQSMKTLDAMNKLTEGLLKPYVDQLEKTQYYEGMAKVAQGQALKEVEEQDPWYMNITGPSATVRGAQAMTATTALQQAETDYMQAMPELRKQSPEQVRGYLVDKAAKISSTGDPLVDATVQAKLAEGWGPMMKTHVREHLAWQQEDMFQKYTSNNIAVGNHLKAMRDSSTTGWVSQENESAYAAAVEAAHPLPGQSEDSWNKATAESLRANLDAGNFDYYEALKNSALWGKIHPKVREGLDANYHGYVMKDAQKNPAITNLSTDSAGFEFNVQHGLTNISSPEELDKYIDGYNTQYTRKNGSSMEYYDNKSRAAIHKSWMSGKLQREQSLATLASKDAEKADKYRESYQTVLGAFTAGTTDLPNHLIDETASRDSMNDVFNNEVGSGDPEKTNRFFQRAAQVSGNTKLRSSKLESMLQSGADGILTGGGALTSQQRQAYGYAAMLLKEGQEQGMAALTNYLGSADKALKLTAMINSGASPDDEKAMSDQRRRVQEGGAPVASKDEKDAIVSLVTKSDPGWFKRLIPFVGGPGELSPFELNEQSKKFLGDAVAGRAAQYARAYKVTPEQAARAVLEETIAGSDMVGGAVILNKMNVRGDVSLSSAVNRISGGKVSQANSNYQEAVRSVIAQKLRDRVQSAGGDMANFNPDDFQVTDGVQLGGGQLNLHLFPKKAGLYGKYDLRLNPQEVADAIKRIDTERSTRVQQEAKKNPARVDVVDTGFGPTIAY